MLSKLKKIIYSSGFSYSAVFIAGLLLGALIVPVFTGQRDGTGALFEIREGGFRYINPLLECEGASATIGSPELRPFKYRVAALIEEARERQAVTDVSVYFRDLNNGPVFGINALDKFSPASLMKVPLMMAFYKFADANPAIMKEGLKFAADDDANRDKNIKASNSIQPNRMYAVDELIRSMIIHSDNNAHNLIAKKLSPKFLARTYEDMGLLPPEGELGDFMTVKSYASCFRILFNSSYLSRKMSEKALSILAESEYRNGLVAGVPAGIAVAHKFGERAFTGGATKQLHDCGIVYYPDSPYLLCIMTRGTDFQRLEETISTISKLVFEQVDAHQDRHEFRAGPSSR